MLDEIGPDRDEARARIEATRGLSQSALRAEPFSSVGLRAVATVSVFIMAY